MWWYRNTQLKSLYNVRLSGSLIKYQEENAQGLARYKFHFGIALHVSADVHLR